MAGVNTNIKIDPVLKQQAQDLFDELGLNLTTAVNMFLRQSVREQAIPFRVGCPIPNAETIEALREVEQMKKFPEMGKTYTDVDAMMKELLE
ncbi:MAG: type II toxin-antitoxin system RelB/DinJ family antitoxin [Butyricicoccus sp.]